MNNLIILYSCSYYHMNKKAVDIEIKWILINLGICCT